MKLFLCGGGSGKQIEKALNEFSLIIDKSKPILYVPLAMAKEKYDSCYLWFQEEIKKINIDKFEMVTSALELSEKNFHDYSALFIGGGNTYKLLAEIKQYGNYEKIVNYLNNDGLIFGSSAGAIIFGKDINSCLLDDENNINLKDTVGFNLLNDYSILCHLTKNNLEKNCSYLKEYSQTTKVIYLPEEDVIELDNAGTKILGTKNYVVFSAGEYRWQDCDSFKIS